MKCRQVTQYDGWGGLVAVPACSGLSHIVEVDGMKKFAVVWAFNSPLREVSLIIPAVRVFEPWITTERQLPCNLIDTNSPAMTRMTLSQPKS